MWFSRYCFNNNPYDRTFQNSESPTSWSYIEDFNNGLWASNWSPPLFAKLTWLTNMTYTQKFILFYMKLVRNVLTKPLQECPCTLKCPFLASMLDLWALIIKFIKLSNPLFFTIIIKFSQMMLFSPYHDAVRIHISQGREYLPHPYSNALKLSFTAGAEQVMILSFKVKIPVPEFLQVSLAKRICNVGTSYV